MKITLSDAPLSMEALARMAGGTLHLRGGNPPPAVTYICTDSREADGDTLLSAIRGERVDGHAFLPAAARTGCRAFLCERLPDGWDACSEASPMGAVSAAAIVVEDTVGAFASLSSARRSGELYDLCAVAVTGSVGKTTTKEMLAAVLSAAPGKTVFKKDGNYNSTVGLPLSVMEIPAETDYAVLEMGMSARGEIAAMTAAVRPDIAIVANIGSSHLEHLGTRENIARAKLEIAEGLCPGGILLLNGDEPLLTCLGRDFDGEKPNIPTDIRILRLSLDGSPDADFHAHRITARDGGMAFDLHTPDGVLSELFVPAVGRHLVWAGAFAAAVGQLCGLSVETIRAGLATYRPAALRQSARTVEGVTLIEDCYNAAPESMHAALGVLSLTPATRRIAVLGDMRELGEDTVALHRAVGAEAARLGVDRLVAVGDLGTYIAAGAADAGMMLDRITAVPADDYPVIAEALVATLCPGDAVLFKASRALSLETLSAAVAVHLWHRNH